MGRYVATLELVIWKKTPLSPLHWKGQFRAPVRAPKYKTILMWKVIIYLRVILFNPCSNI